MIYLIWNGENLSSYEKDEITLDDEQDAVGGFIELLPLSILDENYIQAFVNEEGKLIGLDPTALLTAKGNVCDLVAGNIMFVGYDDEGETVGLEDEQIDLINALFSGPRYNFHGHKLPALEY